MYEMNVNDLIKDKVQENDQSIKKSFDLTRNTFF